MNISLNTIKQYIDFELPATKELVKRINEQLGQVEAVTDLSEKYKDVVIVTVVECEKHPNADRLSVCLVDDGGAVKEVERDEKGLVRVVCGAPNVHANMFAAWLPPKSTVPASYGTDEPFVLDARELRGVKSNGMLAAADELALGSDHTGIIEIDPAEWKPTDVEIKPGASFAEAYGLNDTIIELENKMFTHRPDCFGQLGVAREISAILKGLPRDKDDTDTRFVNPDWYWSMPTFASGEGLELSVFNDVPDKAPRFMAVAMKNVIVKPSPLWLQVELMRLGSKTINNIVDITNYAMLLTAQPSHAYDYDKLRGATLGARMAKKGEKATFLNGKTYELTEDDVVIADGEGVIGLGGIIGGGNSEVSADTKNIVIEVATFDMYTLRKSSMRHGIFTDALTRFSKGQSRLQNDRVLKLIMDSMTDVSGAEVASAVFDLPEKASQSEDASLSGEIAVSAEFVNTRLGSKLETWQIAGLLRRVNFAAYPSENDEGTLLVTAPFWRTDIELPEDVVEEVGRLYGFEKLPVELPVRTITPAPQNQSFALKARLRTVLSAAGANEVLTYSFVHENTLKKAGQHPEKAYRLSNAISPDLQYYRLSMTPSLLEKIHPNVKTGHDEFALFEIGKAHVKGLEHEGLPEEFSRVACVYTSKRPRDGAAFYRAKRFLQTILNDLGIGQVTYEPLMADNGDESDMYYEPKRSAVIMAGEVKLGLIGEYKAGVVRDFKLPAYTAGFEVALDALHSLLQPSVYQALSRFPKVTQDISLKVSADTNYADLLHVVAETIETNKPGECDMKLTPLAMYQALDDVSHKTITLRLEIASYEKTLTDKDVNALLDRAAAAAQAAYGAERM